MSVIIVGVICIFTTGILCGYVGYKQGELNGFKIGQSNCDDTFSELIEEQHNKEGK